MTCRARWRSRSTTTATSSRPCFPVHRRPGHSLAKARHSNVCQSRNDDSFFSDWLSIKHNVITHWVDLNDASGDYGFALMSDHTTSYAFGPADPLGLVLAYAGKGLWDRTYSLAAPSEVRYAFMPHGGTWDRARVWGEDCRWNEPMLAQMTTGQPSGQMPARSLVRTSPGTYVTAMFVDRSALDRQALQCRRRRARTAVTFAFVPSQASLIELDGRRIASLAITPAATGEATVKLSIPRFGVRTLRLDGIVKPST